jgi:hypothetical protein
VSEQPTSGQPLSIRPGDVIEIPPGAEPGRRARSLIHVLSTSYRPGDESGFLRGYTLNTDGTRRRGQSQQRSAWAVWRRLAVATVEVELGDGTRPVPLVVAPQEERALPLLAVLSWEQAQAAFGSGYPNAGAYRAAHVHRHEGCGHLTRCVFADDDEPCQAYECHDDTCWDCQLAPPPDEAPEPRTARASTTPTRAAAPPGENETPGFAWVFVTALGRWLLVDGRGGHLGTVVRSGERHDFRWQPMDHTGTALADPSRFRDVAIVAVEHHAGVPARPARGTRFDAITWDRHADLRVEHLLVALGARREQAATAVCQWLLDGRPGRCGDEPTAAGYIATHAYPTGLPSTRRAVTAPVPVDEHPHDHGDYSDVQ